MKQENFVRLSIAAFTFLVSLLVGAGVTAITGRTSWAPMCFALASGVGLWLLLVAANPGLVLLGKLPTDTSRD